MSEEFEQQQLGQKGTFESARAQGKTTDKANNLIDTYGQSGTKTNSNVKSAGRSSGTIPKMDWRARIRPKKGGEDIAYGMVETLAIVF